MSNMLLQISFLSEFLASPVALEGLDTFVHSEVIKQVPWLLKNFSAAFVATLVLKDFFLFEFVVLLDGIVLEVSKQFQVKFFLLLRLSARTWLLRGNLRLDLGHLHVRLELDGFRWNSEAVL